MNSFIQKKEIITKALRENNRELLLETAASFHGHYCPGLAIGVLASVTAFNKINFVGDGLDKIFAVVESRGCFVDAIQIITGCTFGNNGLLFDDVGKIAVTFVQRQGEAFRLHLKSGAREYIRSSYSSSGMGEIYKKFVGKKQRNPYLEKEFKLKGKEAALQVIKLDENKIFEIKEVNIASPSLPESRPDVVCELCGEEVMDNHSVVKEGKLMCFSCSHQEHFFLDLDGIKIYKS